ncbi:MAG: glycosyltransferase family 2 protein [Dissulfuribacterales bacterium]
MNNPLVTILISTYNGERYIRETIESLKKQTYSNLEIIIVDDKSTDKTIDVLETIDGIIIVKNKINKGLNKSVNDALKYCKGKYLVLFGHDDIMLPDRIKKQVDFMESHNCLASFGNSYYMYGDLKSTDLLVKNLFKALLFNKIKNTFLLFMLDLQYNSNSMIARLDAVKKVNGFETWFKNIGESYLYYKIALVGQIMYQDEVLSYYRKHDSNMTYIELSSRKESYKTKIKILEMFFRNYNFRNKRFYFMINKIVLLIEKLRFIAISSG